MQTILFKCDKCGQEWKSTDKDKPQEVNVSLQLNYGCNYPPFAGGYCGTTVSHQTWCRPCIEKFVPTPKPKDQSKEHQTANEIDMLVELLERLGFSRQQ